MMTVILETPRNLTNWVEAKAQETSVNQQPGFPIEYDSLQYHAGMGYCSFTSVLSSIDQAIDIWPMYIQSIFNSPELRDKFCGVKETHLEFCIASTHFENESIIAFALRVLPLSVITWINLNSAHSRLSTDGKNALTVFFLWHRLLSILQMHDLIMNHSHNDESVLKISESTWDGIKTLTKSTWCILRTHHNDFVDHAANKLLHAWRGKRGPDVKMPYEVSQDRQRLLDANSSEGTDAITLSIENMRYNNSLGDVPALLDTDAAAPAAAANELTTNVESEDNLTISELVARGQSLQAISKLNICLEQLKLAVNNMDPEEMKAEFTVITKKIKSVVQNTQRIESRQVSTQQLIHERLQQLERKVFKGREPPKGPVPSYAKAVSKSRRPNTSNFGNFQGTQPTDGHSAGGRTHSSRQRLAGGAPLAPATSS